MVSRWLRPVASLLTAATIVAVVGVHGADPASAVPSRECRSYTGESYVGAVVLNADGTPIGCGMTDAEGAPADLVPSTWPTEFDMQFDVSPGYYTTRLGWACDDCWMGAAGENSTPGNGFPIGFPIDFFGTTYTEVFVNSNGSIAFDAGSASYNEPLDQILDGNPGVVAYGLDIMNSEITQPGSSWGTGRHGDFFYWGRTTIDGHQAFVATWMNIQSYASSIAKTDWNTFQIMLVDVDDAGGDDVDIVVNYGSLQDNNQGYSCDAGNCAAVGVGSVTNGSVQYASMVDDQGTLYNGMAVSEIADDGAHPLALNHLHSTVPGRFKFEMRDGALPEAATVPGPITSRTAVTTATTADLSWLPPSDLGGSPISGYELRWRIAGSADAWTTDSPSASPVTLTGLSDGETYEYQLAAVNGVGQGPWSSLATFVAAESSPPAFTDADLATPSAGVAYEDAVAATGVPTPTYSVTAGALPAGLSLDPSTGVVSGTPTTAGPYSFTISASNGAGPDATAAFSGTVGAATTPPPTTPPPPPASPQPAPVVVGPATGVVVDNTGTSRTLDLSAVPTGSSLTGVGVLPSGTGHWALTEDGGIFTHGTAPFLGSAADLDLRGPAVGLATTPTGGGYLIADSSGGVFAYGDAPFHGSMGAVDLNRPVTGIATDCGSGGYYLVADDGGVFAFGSAEFHGSMGGTPLNREVIAIVPSCNGDGYWLVARDGGVFAFGDAPFFGSLANEAVPGGVHGLVPTASGQGYWLVDGTGAVHPFGDARQSG
jgi:hypothetical protein